MPRRRTETITIQMHDGPRPIPALTDGVFAVHRPFLFDGVFDDRDWNVTHIQTGYVVGHRMPSADKAWAYVAVLRRLGLEQWDFLSPRSRKWRDLRRAAQSVAERHGVICL